MATPRLTIAQVIEAVPAFANGSCFPCAEAMSRALSAAGYSGEVLTLLWEEATFVMSKRHGPEEAVGDNGQHAGVLVDGLVYDNIGRGNGLPEKDWIADFEATVKLKCVRRRDF